MLCLCVQRKRKMEGKSGSLRKPRERIGSSGASRLVAFALEHCAPFARSCGSDVRAPVLVCAGVSVAKPPSPKDQSRRLAPLSGEVCVGPCFVREPDLPPCAAVVEDEEEEEHKHKTTLEEQPEEPSGMKVRTWRSAHFRPVRRGRGWWWRCKRARGRGRVRCTCTYRSTAHSYRR